jgi:hypothetical protein
MCEQALLNDLSEAAENVCTHCTNCFFSLCLLLSPYVISFVFKIHTVREILSCDRAITGSTSVRTSYTAGLETRGPFEKGATSKTTPDSQGTWLLPLWLKPDPKRDRVSL